MERLRRALVCALFFLPLILLPVIFFLTPDRDISDTERRKLAQAPVFTGEALLSGKLQTQWEEYTLDQFPAKDGFRAAKAAFGLYLLGRGDNNGLYSYKGFLCKLEPPLDETGVQSAVKKLSDLQEQYLTQSRCWFSVIPDKNYYAGTSSGRPTLDYDELCALLEQGLSSMEAIPLKGSLALEDYYRTDIHWRQERLQKVTDSFSQAMGSSPVRLSDFDLQAFPGFRGSYAGQYALPAESEELICLTDPALQDVTVYDCEKDREIPLYQPDLFSGNDPYDVYLGGAKALLKITTNAGTGRDLLLFRDSFGSSLAPLLLSQYDTITLIDLRYISSSLLPDYVDFHGQDALFLFSTQIWNQGAMLR